MRKRLILLSILFTSLPVLLAIYRVNEYYEYLNIENMKLEKVKDKINDVDEEIKTKNKEIEDIKVSHDEELKLLELWERRLENLEKEL